jgi:CRP-like cAMP-binding protein
MEHMDQRFHDKLLNIMTNKRVNQGMTLFHEGEKEEYIFWIHSGKVKLIKTTGDGRELTLVVCAKDEMIGELSLFDPDALYTSTAVVFEDGEIGVMQKSQLELLLSKDPDLSIEFMKRLSLLNRINQSKFRDLMLYGKQGALYSTLIRMTNSYGIKKEDGIFIDMKMSNQELADFIGVARETLNRMVNELKRMNVISYKDGYITVHDLQYLRKYMECGDCPADVCRI